MTARSTPPDFSLFSQFVDRELGPEEEREVNAYMLEHPEAREQVARIEHATQHVTLALSDTSLWEQLQPRRLLPTCLSPEEIAAYLTHSLSRQEKERMDEHLQTCDACLLEAVEARKISSVLGSGQLRPIPDTVTSRAEAFWKPSLSRIVIQMMHRGLHQVTQYLTAPILNFEVEPLAALTRGSPTGLEPPLLMFRLDAAQTSVRVTTVKALDGLALMLTLSTSGHEVLAGKRVQIRQGGLAVFSAKTDAQGTIHVPYLSPGLYDIACPELDIAFQLELNLVQDHA